MSGLRLYTVLISAWMIFLLFTAMIFMAGKNSGAWDLQNQRLVEIEKRLDEIDDQIEYGVH